MIISRKALKAAMVAADNDESRFSLAHIRVQPDGTLESTNGHIAFRIKSTWTAPDEDFPSVGMKPLLPLTIGAYIPVGVADRLIKATAKKDTIPVLTSIQVGEETKGGSQFAQATDLTMPVTAQLPRPEDVRFPDLERSMVKAGAHHIKVVLSAEVLKALAKVAEVIATNKHSANGVCFEIPLAKEFRSTPSSAETEKSGNNGEITSQIRVSMTSGDTRVEGVVMPCRV